MVFTSHIFIFYFLPLCLLLYYALTEACLSRSEGAVFLVLYATYVGLLAVGAWPAA